MLSLCVALQLRVAIAPHPYASWVIYLQPLDCRLLLTFWGMNNRGIAGRRLCLNALSAEFGCGQSSASIEQVAQS